jgi:hypothetical protein
MPVFAVRCGTGRCLRAPVWLLLLGLLSASPSVLAVTPHNVLVIYSNSRLLPATVEGDRGLVEGFAARPDLTVAVSAEFLDQPSFSGEAYLRTFVTYLREKYAAHPPDAILTGSNEALDFMLRHRAELFEHVPPGRPRCSRNWPPLRVDGTWAHSHSTGGPMPVTATEHPPATRTSSILLITV